MRLSRSQGTGATIRATMGPTGGCSSMVEHQLPKLNTRVRFPSPALLKTTADRAEKPGLLRFSGRVESARRLPLVVVDWRCCSKSGAARNCGVSVL